MDMAAALGNQSVVVVFSSLSGCTSGASREGAACQSLLRQFDALEHRQDLLASESDQWEAWWKESGLESDYQVWQAKRKARGEASEGLTNLLLEIAPACGQETAVDLINRLREG